MHWTVITFDPLYGFGITREGVRFEFSEEGSRLRFDFMNEARIFYVHMKDKYRTEKGIQSVIKDIILSRNKNSHG